MQITAIQIAAGLSSRMGGPNKLLEKLDAETSLLQLTTRQLINSKVDQVIVVTGRDAEAVEAEIKGFATSRLQMVHNAVFEQGMTSSIQTGLQSVIDADAIMICLSDMPTLSTADYDALVDAFKSKGGSDKILAPFKNGKKGNPVIFGSAYFQSILAHNEPNGCSSIIKTNQHQLIKYDAVSNHYFEDIDTPEALEAYKNRVRQEGLPKI